MPIQPQQPPPEVLQALRDAAETTPQSYDHIAVMIHDILGNLDLRWPHPMYIIKLRAMASTGGVSKARQVGWRFLAQSNGDRNYAITVQGDADGATYQVAELDHGPFVDSIYKVLEDQDLAEALGAVVYWPAALRINVLNIFAVWLRAEGPDNDIIIPLPPTPGALEAGRLYTREQFENVLRVEAKEELGNDTLDA